MAGVVHVICASLRPDASSEAVETAVSLAHGLREASGARFVVVGKSDRAIASVAWLDGRDALEPFAASPAHMAFIMRGLAPCVSGMWSAAIESEAGPPGEAIESVWVFGLRDLETLFEWQVRALVEAVEALPGHAAAGATIEERERYRAGGAVCLDGGSRGAFETALAEAREGWRELAPVLDDELLAVVRAD